MEVQELSTKEFDEFIKKGVVFIDFFADWCMPCVVMSSIINELADKFKGKIKFGKVDVSENNSLAQKYAVKEIPNMLLFKDGKLVDRVRGAISYEFLEEKLKKNL